MLAGREAEIEVVTGSVRRAVAGSGAAVVVEGEPGIGKTTLLAAVAELAAASGCQVHRGRAEEIDQRIPFAMARSCFGLAAPRVNGAGALTPTRPDVVLAEALVSRVEDWCAAGPVALVLDDLHWADAGSVRALSQLNHRIGQLPLLVVLALRPVPREEDVDRLLRDHDGRGWARLRLGPLGRPAVVELVAGLVGAPPHPALIDVVAGAAGNPLYITECVNVLARAVGIDVVDGTAGANLGGVRLPPSIGTAIRQHLDFLSPPVQELLRVAAVLGRDFDAGELALLLDRPVAALLGALTEAIHCGLLVETGATVAFRHDLIWAALREGIPHSARIALHRQAGHALAGAGAPVERVAEQFRAGGDLDTRAVAWLVDAAPTLLVRAPDLAAELLATALAVRPDSLPLRGQLANALLAAGRFAEVEPVVRSSPAGDPMRWSLAQALLYQGLLPAAEAEARQALDTPGPLTARFRGLAAYAAFLQGRYDAARKLAEQVVANEHTDGEAAVYGWTILANVHIAEHRPAVALELAERALTVATQDVAVMPQIARAYGLVQLDRLAEAQQAFEDGLRLDESSTGAFRAVLRAGSTMVRFLDGRWDEALVDIQLGSTVDDRVGLGQALAGYAALIAVHRADPAGQAALTAEPHATIGGQYYLLLRRWARALAEEAAGEPDRALAELHDCWVATGGVTATDALLLCPDIARLATLLGDSRRLYAVADRTAELASLRANPSTGATAAFCAGLVAKDTALLDAAARDYRLAGRPLFEGYAHECVAAVRAVAGDTAAARTSLESARHTYARLDATWDLARAGARLRELGVRPGPHGPRGRPKTGWDALTRAEARVAALVAEGRSNPDIATRLFLSRSTVQCHVSSILAKLTLSSRVQLAIAWVERHGRLT